MIRIFLQHVSYVEEYPIAHAGVSREEDIVTLESIFVWCGRELPGEPILSFGRRTLSHVGDDEPCAGILDTGKDAPIANG